MTTQEHHAIVQGVRRIDPDHDADRMHDAYLEEPTQNLGRLVLRARLRSIDEIRRRKRFGTFLRQYQAQTSERSNPEPIEQLMSVDAQLLVRQALNRLPEQHRAVMTLRHIDNRTVEEIASFLNKPMTTIYHQLSRAKAALAADPTLKAYRTD